MATDTADIARLSWTEGTQQHSLRWRSENNALPPRDVVLGHDGLTVEAALALVRAGTGILWRGDFQRARQLVVDLGKHLPASQAPAATGNPTLRERYEAHRAAQAERAGLLGLVLLPFDADGSVPLRRAPDVRAAVEGAWGSAEEPFAASLRELLGAIGAYEWRKKGVPVSGLDAHIHPYYGVFSPVRGDYVGLVAAAPLPAPCTTAFDIGTGTGVLAAVLSRRGVPKVIATDQDPRALECASENARRHRLRGVEVVAADLYPAGRASLVVCNPPWLPGVPTSRLEAGVYDPDSRMLRGFLSGLADHLEPGGEGWLVLSDLAERLGLRAPGELAGWMAAAGLNVVERHDTRPIHGKATNPTDPLHSARSAEITSLWRLTSRLAGESSARAG